MTQDVSPRKINIQCNILTPEKNKTLQWGSISFVLFPYKGRKETMFLFLLLGELLAGCIITLYRLEAKRPLRSGLSLLFKMKY